jgi:hypothetical protein
MTENTLPTWEQMTDLDKGATLLHLHKREWEGEEYAVEEYPAKYFDDPRLTAMDEETACLQAVTYFADNEAAWDALGAAEYERLYDLALDADRKR